MYRVTREAIPCLETQLRVPRAWTLDIIIPRIIAFVKFGGGRGARARDGRYKFLQLTLNRRWNGANEQIHDANLKGVGALRQNVAERRYERISR